MRDFHPTGPSGVNPASTATQCPLRLRWMHSSSADDCMPPCHCGRYGCAVTNSIRMFLLPGRELSSGRILVLFLPVAPPLLNQQALNLLFQPGQIILDGSPDYS